MMMMGTSLANSNICRICAVEYTEGFGLFEESEDKASLVILINKYLPISVVNDGLYPDHICERCHTGMAATVDLIDRMVEGQHTLRTMLQKATALEKEEVEVPSSGLAEGSALPSTTLVDLQSNAPDIPMDDITRGCEAVKVYGSTHPLTHSVAGTTLKKKRGRPKKVQTLQNQKPKQQYHQLTDADTGRPRRKTTMPSRFRDTVAGDALESLMLNNSDPTASHEAGEPSIFVAGEGPEATPATDLPFALNIEILEQDGHFILRGIEHLGDFKQLEPASAGDQQRTLVLQQNPSLNDQKDGLHLQTPTHIENGYLLNDAGTIDSKLDFGSMKSDDFSSGGIILNTSLKSEEFSSSGIILSSNLRDNVGQGTLTHDSELEHYDIIASGGQQYQITIPKDYQNNNQHHNSNNNQNDHSMQQSFISNVQQHQSMLSNSSLSDQHHQPLQQQFTSTHHYQIQQQQQQQHEQLPQVSQHQQELQLNLTQSSTQVQQPESRLHFTNSSDGQQFLHITSSASHLSDQQQQQQQFLISDTPSTTQYHHQQQQQQHPDTAPPSKAPPFAPPTRTSVKRTARRGPRRKARFKCNICAKTFLREGRYKHHMFLHGTVVVQCVTCSVKFHDRQQLTDHQTLTGHQGVGIVELSHLSAAPTTELRCKVCPNRTFVSLEGYEKHMSSVHERGGKPISCTHCDKKFVYQHSLRCHMRQCHQEGSGHTGDAAPERQHPCSQCGKVFTNISSLAYHTDTVHNNGRFFVCSLCGMPFRHKQLLQRHYAVHTTLRPHECHICKKTFKTRCNLANHFITHSQEKKYTCEICGKQFNHVTSITLHIRSHTGEKPFACPHCDKKFAQNGNLQEHIRIHTGEKPFSCNVCQKRFTTSSQARHHSRIHERKDKKTTTNVASGNGGTKNFYSVSSRKSTSNQTTIHIKNAITNNDVSEGNVAITYLPSFCSVCCETLEDAEAVRTHRCHPLTKTDGDNSGTDIGAPHHQQKQEQLQLLASAGGSHTWLVAGPASSEGGLGDGGGGSAATDGTSNIIYILSENDEDGGQPLQGHTYEALQQGGVQLVEAGQLTVQDGGDTSWQPQQHDGLQMYSDDGGELLPTLVAAAGEDQPTVMQQESGEGQSSKQSSGPITLLLDADPTKLIAQLQHHQ